MDMLKNVHQVPVISETCWVFCKVLGNARRQAKHSNL